MMDMNASSALNVSVNSTEVIGRINAEKYAVPIVFGIIFMVGAVGNGSLMFIICRYKSMRNLPNIFVFNLALGDFLVLLFAVPFTSSIYTFDVWPFGEFLCKASEFAKDTSVSVSVFTLTALSFDRYNVIVKPVQSYIAGPKSKQCIIISLTAIWLASLALALPAAIFSRLIDVKQVNSSTIVILDDVKKVQPKLNRTQIEPSVLLYRFCYPFPGKFGVSVHSRSVILGRFLIQYLIPLVIIGAFYTITARKLMLRDENTECLSTTTTFSSIPNSFQSSSTTPSTNNPNNSQHFRPKVAVIVQSLVALFFIGFLPMHIFFLWFYFDVNSQMDYNHFWHSLKIVGFVFAYTNSCINPIALYFISTNFRKHFDRLLFCCCRNSSDNQTTQLRPRDQRRQDDNEFQQHGSNPLTSSVQTLSDKRMTSSPNESDVPQIAVFTVYGDSVQIIHRNPSFTSLTSE